MDMTRKSTLIVDKPIKPCASGDSASSHFEIEVKVGLENKEEAKLVEDWLYGQGYVFEKKTLIADFVEPSKSVTSRVRLERTLNERGEGASFRVDCYTGKKCHPIAGELEDFVRQESDPAVTAEVAIDMLMRAIEAQNGEPIPYYTKKRRYFSGLVGSYPASISLDKPKGLRKKFTRRFMEVEIQLPLTSTERNVAAAVNAINAFILRVLGENRAPEISYRKMVMKTWQKRGMLKKRPSKSK
jgi:hypothetical protein